MGLRRNYIDGTPVIEHSASQPRVYLDTCALDLVTNKYGDRFSNSLNSKKGTLCLSFFNLTEFISYKNQENKTRILSLIDSVESVLIDVDPQSVISKESWYEKDFIKQCEPHINPLGIFNLKAVIEHLDEEILQSGEKIKESFEKNIYPQIIEARKNKKKLAEVKLRKSRKQYCKENQKASVDSVFLACLDYIIANETMKMDDGEWRDTFHTVVPVCCCDFILIDSRWTQFLVDVGLKYPQIGKVFNSKKEGIENFFSDLEKCKL